MSKRRRITGRMQPRKNLYRIVTGHAGFILLFKNGERIQPKNFVMEFKV